MNQYVIVTSDKEISVGSFLHGHELGTKINKKTGKLVELVDASDFPNKVVMIWKPRHL